MPEGNGSPEGGQGTGQDSGAGSGAGQGSQQGGSEGSQGTPSDGGQSQRSDDAAAVIARLNAEAKDWRQKYEAEQTKVREFEQQGLSELEKAQQRLAEEERRRTELEQQNQELRLAGVVREAAVKAKALDPDLIWRTVDLSRVEYDAKGQPTNLDALVAEVRKAHPILFETPRGSADGGARGGAAPSADMNELIRRGAMRGSA